MSVWSAERTYVTRYLGSGVANTLVGFAVIFLLLLLGATPIWANVCGYVVGLTFGFLLSKNFVFHAEGNSKSEGVRYSAAFAFSFSVNLLVLQVLIKKIGLHAVSAQIAAAATYTLLMYALSRYFVFTKSSDNADRAAQDV